MDKAEDVKTALVARHHWAVSLQPCSSADRNFKILKNKIHLQQDTGEITAVNSSMHVHILFKE